MKKIIVVIVFLIISCILQHISHELFHVIAGKKLGLSLVKIQWFTYHGGTKVYFKGEDEVVQRDNNIPKEWVYMNLAGILGTTILAYFFGVIYFILDMGYMKLFMWVLATIFLLTDSSYALVCSFGDCGDFYLVNKYLRRKNTLKMLSLLIFIANCFLAFLIYKYK